MVVFQFPADESKTGVIIIRIIHLTCISLLLISKHISTKNSGILIGQLVFFLVCFELLLCFNDLKPTLHVIAGLIRLCYSYTEISRLL